MPEPLFVDQIHLMALPGFHAAVKEAARREGQTASEFIRQAIRAQLKRAEASQAQPAAGD